MKTKRPYGSRGNRDRNTTAFAVLLAVLLILLLVGVTHAAERPKPITVSFVVDPALVSQAGGVDGTNMLMMDFINNLNWIYEPQAGVRFNLGHVELASVVPSLQVAEILYALQEMRAGNSMLNETSVTVFITSRMLFAGREEFHGYASTEGMQNKLSVIALRVLFNEDDFDMLAHEMAHVFGAPHDGEGVCANEPPTTYLMRAHNVGGHRYFSKCTIDVIKTEAARLMNAAPVKLVSVGVPVQLFDNH